MFKPLNSVLCKILMVFAFLSSVTVTHAIDAKKSDLIEHLEPAFWWVGMQHPELQLLVHGDNLSLSEPRVNYPGVSIKSVQRTDNANYLFINLSIAKNTEAGSFDIQFFEDNALLTSYPYQLKTRKTGSAKRQGFSSKDVIYLITPDRYANGDSSNDSVIGLKEQKNRQKVGGRHGGDLQGIVDNLDYIHEMGFTQIWTMPIMLNDMQRYSYHGYSTTDYYQVDPRFGSNELYVELSQKAAERGIGVIQDVILNHIGSEHWWMKDKPSKDWINSGGTFKPTSHRREALHDPHATENDVKGFSDGWFVPTMPDLNQKNPLLATYLIQNAIWWIEYAQLSGLRVDTYSYSDMAFLSVWTQRIMLEYPNLNIVGEEWSVNPAIVAFWQQGSTRHSDYQSWLPSVMDFPTQAKMIEALTETDTWSTGLLKLYDTLANDFLYGDPYNLVVFADNHDMSRIYSQLNENEALFKMAMTYILTTRGIPQVFYGTEIMMANPGTDDHGVIRSDFPGGWDGDSKSAFTGQGLTKSQLETQAYFKTLLNWRKKSTAITQGKLKHYAPQDGVYVYFRYSDTQNVMVVLNKNDKPVELPLARFSEMLGDTKRATDILQNRKVALTDHVILAPVSATVLELK